MNRELDLALQRIGAIKVDLCRKRTLLETWSAALSSAGSASEGLLALVKDPQDTQLPNWPSTTEFYGLLNAIRNLEVEQSNLRNRFHLDSPAGFGRPLHDCGAKKLLPSWSVSTAQ